MAGIIILSQNETSTNDDILQGTRLQTVPAGGFLTFEMQADQNSDTDNSVASIQLPSGDTPMESVNISAGDGAETGVLDEREMLKVTFGVAQGGHTVFGVTITGTSVFTWRVTYTPAGSAF